MPAFIAANYVMTYYCKHNICPMETDIPEATDTVQVSRNLHSSRFPTYAASAWTR